MSVGAVYDSSGYSFGSVASVRKQAAAIKARAKAGRDARMAEQDKTGLIRNPETGEMVQLLSISKETREEWNDREDLDTLSIGDVMTLFKAADPNAEEVEKAQARGARYSKIQDKMLAGKKLTGEEKKFLQENYPEVAAQAARVEQEVDQLEKRLKGSKSKDEARQIYMDTKTRLMSGANKNDPTLLLITPALDEAYARHTGRGGTSKKKIDTWA